jgi:glycosyltransferase involved in cell wall biosynthesis
VARELPTISVIVPTAGKATLPRTLESIAPQLRPGDEILVVCNRDMDFGAKARNEAMPRAKGTHLAFLDDDDEFKSDALEKMRHFAAANPGRIGIFREELADLSLHWKEPVLRIGNVGTVLFFVPNMPDKLGVWAPYEGDWRPCDWMFISSTVERMGEPIFVDEVTVRQRPGGTFATPLDALRYRLKIRTRFRMARARLLSR